MRMAVVMGTGGHCRVILSILTAGRRHDILEIIELGTPRPGERILGTLVSSSPDGLLALRGREDVDVFLAIGRIDLRKHWWEKVKSIGLQMPNLISPHALIDDTAVLGESNVICPRSFIGPHAVLGNNNLINTMAVVEHEVTVGNHCHLAPSSTVAGRSRIGSECFVGVGASIIDGVSIASSTIIGAGAAVIRGIDEAGGTYVGLPARRRDIIQ